MSTIQNLKNFIRHGKQARGANPPVADPTTNVSPIHAHQQPNRHQHHTPAAHRDHYAISDPNFGHPVAPPVAPPPTEFSAANVDQRNVAAQAGGVAAKAAGDHQRLHDGAGEHKAKNYDTSVIERIVAEERESKGKLPKYPGLDRWTLLEKMGDGAFSNVYRAKDNTGKMGEVAIKVVRKFEMSSTQVCLRMRVIGPFHHHFHVPYLFGTPFYHALPTRMVVVNRAITIYIRTSRSSQRLWRCALPSHTLIVPSCARLSFASCSS